MPNNLQILAYIQCMKDKIHESMRMQSERPNPFGLGNLNIYLRDIENLEKFIRGENNGR